MLYINEKSKLSTFFLIVSYKRPPLKERRKDPILLSQYFIDGYTFQIAVVLGLTLSVYEYGGLKTLSQFLEVGIAAGF